MRYAYHIYIWFLPSSPICSLIFMLFSFATYRLFLNIIMVVFFLSFSLSLLNNFNLSYHPFLISTHPSKTEHFLSFQLTHFFLERGTQLSSEKLSHRDLTFHLCISLGKLSFYKHIKFIPWMTVMTNVCSLCAFS